MRTRKKYNTQPKNNNVYSANTFDDLVLEKIHNIYMGEKLNHIRECGLL